MPSIYERRSVQVGDGGLTIMISKAWAAYHCLEAGDVVKVKPNGKFVIEPPVVKKRKGKGHPKKQ